jgi:hypothetical protein
MAMKGSKWRYICAWGTLFAIAFISAGCTLLDEPKPLFSMELLPESGHPPFSVEIRVTDMGEGSYTFELPNETIEQSTNVLYTTVDADFWQVRVTWTNSEGDQQSATATANVINGSPTIRRPEILPGMGWFLTPLSRTLLDFNYKTGAVYGATGISDPDGDAWHIVSIEVMCSEKFGLADSIFCPPREPGFFHAYYRGEIIENACIVYPTHTGAPHPVVSSSAPLTERIEFVEPFAFAYPGSTEYFRLRNTGYLTVDLSGWTVTSDQGEVFRFPQGFRMQASAVVQVYTRSGTNSASKLYWDHEGGEVWHNTQGSAILRNAAGVVVHEYIYPGLPFARTQEDGYPYAPNPHDLTFDHLAEWFSDSQHFIDWADKHIPSWREAYKDKGSVEDIMAYFFSNLSGNMLPTIRSGTATITVTASDEWGATSSASFEISIGARDFF